MNGVNKKKQTFHMPGIASLAKLYLAARFTRYPGRYIEILSIMHRYRLATVIRQLGLQDQYNGECGGSDFEDNSCIEYAEHLARALEELGTCFIKLGQVMSTRPDLLPPEYVATLSRLQDRVMPVPGDEIAAIIESELGASLSKLFLSFDRKPLATASIAQVHRATLPDGTPVVVKVQRPGVQHQVERDIAVMQEVARFATRYTSFGSRYGLVPIVQEIKQSLSQELDFQQEADNTRLVSQGLSEFKHLTAPRIYPDYISRRVLTQSFLQGRHLSQVPRAELGQIDTLTMAQELLSAYLKQMVVDGIFHCDPHPGNILLTDDGQLALLDFGMVGRFDAEQKEKILLLLLAFAERQGERVADTYLDMIEAPENCDRQAFTQEICTLTSRYHDLCSGRMEVGKVLLELATTAQAHRMAVPAQLTLLGKAVLNLDGTLRALAPELNPIETIRSYMEQVMQQRALAHMSLGRAYSWFLDARHLLDNLPRRTDTVLDKLAHDRLTLHLRIDRLDEVIKQAARQMSFGMILSSVMLCLGLWFVSRREKRKSAKFR
jgi:ubiquinone biosynthesis protein